MKNPPQFLRGETTVKASAESTRTDRAIYQVPGTEAEGKLILIAVACTEGGGNVPRNATSFQKLTQVTRIDLESELESVAAVATSVLNSLKALRPGEVEIEFGVELGGSMGIPLITSGQAKANFKITLKWKASDKVD